MNEIEETQLRSEVETLRQLLEVHEATAMAQAEIAERALADAVDSAAALAAKARQMDEVMEASSECVMVLDGDWVVRYMNTQAVKTMASEVDLIGRRLQDVYPSIKTTVFWEKFLQVMTTRQATTFEEMYTSRQRWFVVNVTPVGEGIALFFRDVTERKRQDAMLQRTEKLAAVGRLASSISHEINNPLESVVNLLYLIEHSESAGDEMRAYASLAASELARVSHIVTHTLKFHRQSTRAGDCRMSEILESVLSLYQGRLATQKIAIRRDFAPGDNVLCFAGDMRQVFANLIGNALDAMRGEGTLYLRTRRTIDWKTGAKGLRVVIADTGCGMSEATRQRIFEAFFTTKAATGTGLGLWVSEEIIRNHKGTVRVRSSEKPGRSGTVFSIFFPIAVDTLSTL
jgi:signal transduction histidine kinase